MGLQSLIAMRAAEVEHRRFVRVALVTALVGTVYTVFSEWLNTVARQGWEYSESMPVLPLFGAEIGRAAGDRAGGPGQWVTP
jgi:hypothetical protein